MRAIVDADLFHVAEPGMTVPESIVFRHWAARPDRRPFVKPDQMSGLAEPEAVVNHGRWIVHCPFCTGAQHASKSDRKFLCVTCWHRGTAAADRWLLVLWPTDAMLEAVERELLRRPDPRTRNWRPGETPTQLSLELGDHTLGEARWQLELEHRDENRKKLAAGVELEQIQADQEPITAAADDGHRRALAGLRAEVEL